MLTFSFAKVVVKRDVAGERAISSVRDNATAAAFDLSAGRVIEFDICLRYRPNVLVIGSAGHQRQVLRRLSAAAAGTPFQIWPLDNRDRSPRRIGTVIIRDAADLDAEQQARINDWLSARTEATQVISFSERPVYPLVEQGAFLNELYYQLNSVVIDCRVLRSRPQCTSEPPTLPESLPATPDRAR